MKKTSCPQCGLSASEFGESGQLGCAACYRAFKETLVPLFKQIHGNEFHRGKVPVSDPSRQKTRRELIDLRRALKKAVGREAYEQAADLRDRINELERGADLHEIAHG
ncbi:MAG: UvrB/UvrC motif-containing protein [Gemmatimonadetes bacterium]|nr:UvrB/UvrC motif-containing protein [Gemmatimonadota bacterium]